MNRFLRCAALIGLVGVTACDLVVSNPNQPETERVLASPADVEALLRNYYLRWHSGPYGANGVRLMMNVQSFENYSSLSNNCQGQRVGIPRPVNDNSIGNGCGGDQQRMYQFMNEVARVATSILKQFDDPTYTLENPSRDLRAKAFAEFLRGISLGYLALQYDSSAVVSVNLGAVEAGPLRGYLEVLDSSKAALSRAITYINDPGLTATHLPITWIPTPTVMTAVEFERLVRSYRARFEANVARNGAERAARDWAGVIADVNGGITADHINTTNSVTGPFNASIANTLSYGTWHQMTPFFIGMADNSGSYAAWIGLPLDQRGTSGAFFMTTPDLRWPQGGSRAAQQADFNLTVCNTAGSVCPRYFVNRTTGSDVTAAQGWGASNYDFARFKPWHVAGSVAGATAQNGPFPFIVMDEMRLLRAEGNFRLGNFAAALTDVNVSRTRNNLPALTAADNSTQVPGGGDCVPKVPFGPAFNQIRCGTLFDAIKYEKRMETAFQHYGAWYFDGRGWDDLAEGTPLHWAPPYQDLQARGYTGAQIYSTGTATAGKLADGTTAAVALRGTYGF